MKAYQVWDSKSYEDVSIVVFAEDRQQARKIAFDSGEYSEYINVRAKRLPEADKLYKGQQEADWYDLETRMALVKLGWSCSDISDDCDTCPAQDFCCKWEDM